MRVITRKRLNDFADAYRDQVTSTWSDFSKYVHVLHNAQDYTEAVKLLDNLIDAVGENEQHPLASLMELVGVLIEQYEDAHVPEITDYPTQTMRR